MSIAPYIKDIGRGKDGTRSLSTEQAHDLMSQVLAGRCSDLEVGAFAMAMRIKGESTDELDGFLRATHAHCLAFAPTRPLVVLPSYNGARKLPNLTALLALLLAQDDVAVLVHGPAHDPGRVTTAEIFHDLGLPLASDAAGIEQAWARHEPAFITTATLCPPLARLLEVRRVIGVRNSGHTLAKLLDPTPGQTALRVVNHTHPDYAQALAEFMQHTRGNAVLLRGTEGEPVVDPRRAPRLSVFVGGTPREDLAPPAANDTPAGPPLLLPCAIDAATTAAYIQSVISGEKPAPAPLVQQARCLVRTLAALAPPGTQEKLA